MLYPSISELSKNKESRYSLVIGVAKRAREIADVADKNNITLKEKPVKTAINEIYNNKIRIIEHK